MYDGDTEPFDSAGLAFTLNQARERMGLPIQTEVEMRAQFTPLPKKPARLHAWWLRFYARRRR